MKNHTYIAGMLSVVLSGAAVHSTFSASVNTWRGDAVSADWNEPHKWHLHHPPTEGEAAHFREANSVISVNSTVQLENGMHLYGDELLINGNGNINLWSQVPHERSVNIPASATGFANLTLCDNISLNGRISLSAKGFGTSASKGTLTLKDRSTVTGGLVIGNEGVGSGRVVILDNATFRITQLMIDTRADKGGLAEIHIMGGTVRIETEEDFFELLMGDPSRRIILGDSGTLRIESSLSIEEKKELIKKLITSKHLAPAPGCQLNPPVLQDEMIIARAEDVRFSSTVMSEESIIAAIDRIEPEASGTASKPADLGELVKALHKEVNELTNTATVARMDEAEKAPSDTPRTAGYIVFFGTVLLALRKSSGQ